MAEFGNLMTSFQSLMMLLLLFTLLLLLLLLLTFEVVVDFFVGSCWLTRLDAEEVLVALAEELEAVEDDEEDVVEGKVVSLWLPNEEDLVSRTEIEVTEKIRKERGKN